MPRIRSYRRSPTARLLGAVLEWPHGRRLLLVSAYMPTGLESLNASSHGHELAHKLYNEMLSWCDEAQQIIVMGDLNQTMTSMNRSPPLQRSGPAAAAASVISEFRI